MKFTGVRIDTQKLEHFGKRLKRCRDKIIKFIKTKTGVEVQLWAATSIKQLLDNRKITNFEKTAKSGMPKLPKDYLKTHEDRFLRLVSKAKAHLHIRHSYGFSPVCIRLCLIHKLNVLNFFSQF